jgi:3-isopropylmalate/(R)-2-methylmalate dehydratase large subunit
MTETTLYDKLWDAHLVRQSDDGTALIYIDRQLLHEVTSPQAFAGLRENGRRPHRRDTNLAVADHNVPTTNRSAGIADPVSRLQVETLDNNCAEFGITEFAMSDPRQGIVHVVGPEQGITQPGMTIVCGDSHTATHGALGALAFGIGTSEVEHVLATQCLVARKMKNLRVNINGRLPDGVVSKDMILAVIGMIGTSGGTGYALEFAGSAVRDASMEGRLTLCNMAIEAGARVGLIGVDDVTIEYMRGRAYSPQGSEFDQASQAWLELQSDPGAVFDLEYDLDASDLRPQVTWGTSPEMVISIDDVIPDPANAPDKVRSQDWSRALEYMDLIPGTPISSVVLDKVFIGACTNGRIEDLRAAAAVIKGRVVADTIKQVLVVPGSGLVKRQAEAEGLDQVFIEAGFEWREPGCSMCLAMNDDCLEPGERCAATSNGNFDGRHGYRGRTHLVSPAMAAAAAIAGHFADPAKL